MLCLELGGNKMDRRNPLKTMGRNGLAGILGTGASETVAADDRGQPGRDKNPGRDTAYNGQTTKTETDLGGFDRAPVSLADGEPTPG